MKKRLLAGLLGFTLSATLLCSTALAATGEGPFKEKREEIKQIQQDRIVKADTLRGLVTQAREEAGIIPLTEEEKTILKAVKEEVLPLVEALKALKAEYQSARDTGDTERIEAIKAEVNELKAQIKSLWDSVSEERAKAKENREKANATYRTESFAAGQKQRHEFREEAKDIHEVIKGLVVQLREAKADNDEAAVAALIDQLSIQLDSLSQNIGRRIVVLDSLIEELTK